MSVLCNAGVDAHDSTVVLNVCSSVDDFVPVAGAIGKLALGLAVGAGWDFEDGDSLKGIQRENDPYIYYKIFVF